jgi:hypothetical protein
LSFLGAKKGMQPVQLLLLLRFDAMSCKHCHCLLTPFKCAYYMLMLLLSAVSPAEVLAQSLSKLQEAVDSLHTDSWMFEVPRHTYH